MSPSRPYQKEVLEANLTRINTICREGVRQLNIKAILFDLHGTLAYVRNAVTHQEASNYLISHGYEVYPQTYMAAWQFVAFIDYPKHGYKDYPSFLKRLLWRISTEVDKETLSGLAELYERNQFELYPETSEAVKKAKEMVSKQP